MDEKEKLEVLQQRLDVLVNELSVTNVSFAQIKADKEIMITSCKKRIERLNFEIEAQKKLIEAYREKHETTTSNRP